MTIGDRVYVLIEHKTLGYTIKTGIITQKKRYGKTCFVSTDDKYTFQTHVKNCFYTYDELCIALISKIQQEVNNFIEHVKENAIIFNNNINQSIELLKSMGPVTKGRE